MGRRFCLLGFAALSRNLFAVPKKPTAHEGPWVCDELFLSTGVTRGVAFVEASARPTQQSAIPA